MNFFCYPSALGAKALIESHYWKSEFSMETIDVYSTFSNGGHVLLSLNKTDNVVCVYSSVWKYKLQSYKCLVVHPEYSLGNCISSFAVDIIDRLDEEEEEDEDVVYEEYDNSHCKPTHRLFFNTAAVRDYDWSDLKLNVDFKLLWLDESKFDAPVYAIRSTQYCQIACHRTKARACCKHVGKVMTNISGGYKQILFDIQTTRCFVCPCTFLKHANEEHSSVKFNYVLLSYKLSQFFLN